MVTTTQLQILQSPIVNLISTISAFVTVKLDDSNYLNWNFLIQLLLESNGIFGFVDGLHPCLSSFDECGTHVPNSSSSDIDCDDALIWKMHDRAIMQLITATLSPVAMSCAIGSRSSKDLWNRLKEQFSTVSKTSIFQLKSNLQNIKKGTDTISQYLLKIKEARDYLSAAGVHFADEDIVILALNGLPSEYNTFRCVIRGRENVIALREFRSQLLAEELIVENSMSTNSTYLAAMNTTSKHSPPFFQPPRGQHGYNTYDNNGYRSFNRGRGRSKFGQGQRPYAQRAQFPAKSQSVGPLSNPAYRSPPMFNVPVCQLCNNEGHTAPVCAFRGFDKPNCTLCGKMNHTT